VNVTVCDCEELVKVTVLSLTENELMTGFSSSVLFTMSVMLAVADCAWSSVTVTVEVVVVVPKLYEPYA